MKGQILLTLAIACGVAASPAAAQTQPPPDQATMHRDAPMRHHDMDRERMSDHHRMMMHRHMSMHMMRCRSTWHHHHRMMDRRCHSMMRTHHRMHHM